MKRRPNFTVAEMDALIEAIAQRRAVVSNSSHVNKAAKEREWLLITSKVNESSSLHRTVTEVRKKWKNLRMVTKAKKEAMMADFVQLCKTGTPPTGLRHLNPMETRVMQILDSCCSRAGQIHSDLSVEESELVANGADSDESAQENDEEENEKTTTPATSEILTSVVENDQTNQQCGLSAEESQHSAAVSGQGTDMRLTATSQSDEADQQAACRQQSKPSIQSVVEALQRRREEEEEAARRLLGDDFSDSVVGVGSRDSELLEVQRQLLEAERQKVATLRQIVGTLREVAATVRTLLVGERGRPI